MKKADLLGITGVLLGFLGMLIFMGSLLGAHYFMQIATEELPPSYYLHRGFLASLAGMALFVLGICLPLGSPEEAK